MNPYNILNQTQRQRVSDGSIVPILTDCELADKILVVLLSQLGDFDSLEYAWWLERESEEIESQGIEIRAIGIGDRDSGVQFCEYTGFPLESLFVDPQAKLHRELGLYQGLSWNLPFLSSKKNAWANLLLMCAGIGSPGTLAEVFRGYKGDRRAPQLVDQTDIIKAFPLPPIRGSFFKLAGGSGFQRPFELATLRLKHMNEVLKSWKTYVPNAELLTQRGGTFLFDTEGNLIYSYRAKAILGFAEDMSNPLSFIYETKSASMKV